MAIEIGSKSTLAFPRRKINEFLYRDYLEESKTFTEFAEFGKYGYLFQQDDASQHLNIDMMNFIEKQAKVLYGWPPNSTDLSYRNGLVNNEKSIA